MAKKKKGGKAVVLDPEELKKQELIAEAIKLKEEIGLETRILSNYGNEKADLERFWELEKENISNCKSKIAALDIGTKDQRARNEAVLNNCQAELKTKLISFLKKTTDDISLNEKLLLNEQEMLLVENHELEVVLHSLKTKFEEEENSHSFQILSLKEKQDQNITTLLGQFQEKSKDLFQQYLYRSKTIHQKIDNETKYIVNKIKNHKEETIQDFKTKHNKKLQDIKNYFSDIIHNNLDLIRNLKEELVELRKKDLSDEKCLADVAQRNKSLSKPLKAALKDIEGLQAEIAAYEHLQRQLKKTMKEIENVSKNNKEMEWKHEICFQKLEFLRREEELVKSKFEAAIDKIKLENDTRVVYLKQKLRKLKEAKS